MIFYSKKHLSLKGKFFWKRKEAEPQEVQRIVVRSTGSWDSFYAFTCTPSASEDILCHKMEVSNSACIPLASPVRVKGLPSCRGLFLRSFHRLHPAKLNTQAYFTSLTFESCYPLLFAETLCRSLKNVWPPLCHPAENMHLLVSECRKDLVVPLALSHSCELMFLSLKWL